MDLNETISRITTASGLSEVRQVTTYEGELEGVGRVEVTVSDRGVGEHSRFSVFARTLDLDVEKTAAGNSDAELDVAISGVHWDDLKR